MPTTRFSLRLLGGFEVLRNGERVSDRCGGKMRALLAYLAAEPAAAHSRQALGSLLWPEQDEDHARQSLRQALTSLRSAIGDRDGPTSLFRADRDSVALNPDSAHEIDVVALDPALLSGCTPGVLRSRAACRQCHEVAAAHYRGPFLAGLTVPDAPEFESWLQCKRQWFGRRAAELFEHLAACYEQSGDAEHALLYAHAQLRVDPWNEAAHRQVIRLLTIGGRRHAAVAHYHQVRTLLADELGVEPEEETRALVRRASAGLIEPQPGLPVERLLRPEPWEPRACPSAPPGHAGERRVLTVLCCEARCAPQEDPEDLHEHASRCIAAAAGIVRQHGGLVVGSDGAGLTAYFGYPETCEEPSLQAVRAAVALRDSLTGGQRLRTRIHTDVVFVPPRLRGSCDTDVSIVGTAPRLVRALHGAAPHIDLAVSANTEALVRGAVESRPLPGLTPSDGREPIALHEVIRVRDVPEPVVADASDPSQRWARLRLAQRVDTLLGRLGRSKALVQLASSLGPQFTEQRLAQTLSQVRNLGLGPLTLAGELERLVHVGIFESWTDGCASGYRFREPAVREAVYRTQSRAQQLLYEQLLAALPPQAGARAPPRR